MKNTAMTKDNLNTRKLTNPQLDLLKLLYKFRFATSTLLAAHRQKNPVTIYGTLQLLLKAQYIAKNYAPSYKLAGRGAEYYLTNTGIRYLRDYENFNQSVLHAMYKNKSLGQPFIQKCLRIYKVYIKLQAQYGTGLTILTRSEVADNDGFPAPLPDLYLYSNGTDYFLELFSDSLFFLVKKRIDQHIRHYESDAWSEAAYPTLLFVLPDSRLESKTQAYIEKTLDTAFIEDGELNFYTTTQKTLLESDHLDIWSSHVSQAPVALAIN
jgi:DNA-binding PadR family transcriptional regulator